MSRHRRRWPLLAILGRLHWQRDAHLWSVPCRDESGRRAVIRVQVGSAGIALSSPASGALTFSPLAVGRLRAALRDAAVIHAALSGDTTSTKEVDHDFDSTYPDRDSADSHAA